MLREDPFGLRARFVGLANFQRVLADPDYLNSVKVTVVFSRLDRLHLDGDRAASGGAWPTRSFAASGFYRTLMIWPYAVAPAIAGMLWLFLFNPSIGTLAYPLRSLRHRTGTRCSMAPGDGAGRRRRLVEADQLQFPVLRRRPAGDPEVADRGCRDRRRRPTRRFWTIVFPLLAPTTFFLLVINTVYAFFDTFGIIHAVTGGGPGKATETLVYKVYNDGFVNLHARRLARRSR